MDRYDRDEPRKYHYNNEEVIGILEALRDMKFDVSKVELGDDYIEEYDPIDVYNDVLDELEIPTNYSAGLGDKTQLYKYDDGLFYFDKEVIKDSSIDELKAMIRFLVRLVYTNSDLFMEANETMAREHEVYMKPIIDELIKKIKYKNN